MVAVAAPLPSLQLGEVAPRFSRWPLGLLLLVHWQLVNFLAHEILCSRPHKARLAHRQKKGAIGVLGCLLAHLTGQSVCRARVWGESRFEMGGPCGGDLGGSEVG